MTHHIVDSLISNIKGEFPSFKIKEAGWVLFAALTLRQTIYVNLKAWQGMDNENKYVLLCHERIHMRQQRRWAVPLFLFLYVLVLPLFFAYFRYIWEREAYTESLKAWKFLECNEDTLKNYANQYANWLYGRLYLWSWPKPWVKAYFDGLKL